MLDILPKRSTITGVYYANLLDQLRTAIREKRRGKLSKGVLLQQDNARVHACKVAMDAVERNGYELIPHSAYSPDLAARDFFLFPNLKKDIRGLHFRSDEEVVTAVEEWVNGKDPDFCPPLFRRNAEGHCFRLSVVRAVWSVARGAWFRIFSRYLVPLTPPTIFVRSF